MAINIKNERVCELAREAARASGLTQTSALEAALERYLSDLREQTGEQEQERRRARIDMIVEDFQRVRIEDPLGDLPGSDHAWLYDDATGLPR